MSRAGRGAFSALLAVLLALVAVAPVAAQDGEVRVPSVVLKVDARSDDTAQVIIRHGAAPDSVQAKVNGSEAEVAGITPLSAVDDPSLSELVMFVLDNSETGRTDSREQFAQLREAVRGVMEEMPAGTKFGIVTSGGGANLRIGLNDDLDRTLQVLDGIQPAGKSALWDALKLAAGKFVDRRDLGVGSIVIVSANASEDGEVPFAAARADVLRLDVGTHVIAVPSGGAPTGELRALASVTGGSYHEAEDHAATAGFSDDVAEQAGNTYLVTLESDAVHDGGDLVLDVDGTVLTGNYVPGSVTTRTVLGIPLAEDEAGGLPFLAGKDTLTIGLLLGGIAIGLAAYAVIQLFQKPDSELNQMLQVYSAPGAPGQNLDNETRMALYQRAVQVTEQFAERQGLIDKVDSKLERADMPLRAAEALLFYIGIVMGGFVLGVVLTRSLLGTAAVTLLALLIPPAVLDFKAKKRKKRFVEQLPDMLTLLASTLKAGYSFMQGVEAVSHEVEGPMGKELRRVVTESQLGRPVDEALEASAERMDSPDFAWAVMAVRIQREVGGNLSELLMTVADTMVARQRLRGEVAALTAEGKMSAIVLGLLPGGLGAVMFAINPDYAGVLLDETLGKVMIVLAVIGMIVGFLWMKKIITIDI